MERTKTRKGANGQRRTFAIMIFLARLRFCSSERVSWQTTRMPVGLWTSWTLFAVLLIAWPPYESCQLPTLSSSTATTTYGTTTAHEGLLQILLPQLGHLPVVDGALELGEVHGGLGGGVGVTGCSRRS